MLYQKVSNIVPIDCDTVELTYVTSRYYVININDPRNTNNFIDHLLPKHSVSAHEPPNTPGPQAPTI